MSEMRILSIGEILWDVSARQENFAQIASIKVKTRGGFPKSLEGVAFAK